ncbi:MAG: glycosyltransferase family 2 protein [Pseudolabrys sp.]|nr:glycosyltransferase family 2 protein [Pseudolabrys sp.]
MSPPATIWIVIAAYNEGRAIGDVIGALRPEGYSVVVVDDCSRDETAAVARQAGASVLRHAINLGQGAALQTGIEFALAQGAEILVTFDADGQHRVSDIPALTAALGDAHADFALGSRVLGGTVNAPPSRKLLLWLATVFTRLTTGMRITDTHNGLRAMTRRGAQAIKLRQNRMAHASEILDQIAASGLTYVEVPVTIEYSEYSLAKGQSFGDALTIVFDLFARRLHR